jgi:hypothetical protein
MRVKLRFDRAPAPAYQFGMGWLRKERDLIGLVVVWTILLQSIVLPFTTGLHAATLTSGAPEGGIICTSRGTAVTPESPAQKNSGSDCQCCHMSCRQSCGGGCGGGILPTFVRVPLPSSALIAVAEPRSVAPAPQPAKHATSQPRAPPLT